MEAGFAGNDCNICVFNNEIEGIQCTIAVYVDDMIITSVCGEMIEDVCTHVKERCGNITRCDGPVQSYLEMVFDLSKAGEARMTMKGYIELKSAVKPGVPPLMDYLS